MALWYDFSTITFDCDDSIDEFFCFCERKLFKIEFKEEFLCNALLLEVTLLLAH